MGNWLLFWGCGKRCLQDVGKPHSGFSMCCEWQLLLNQFSQILAFLGGSVIEYLCSMYGLLVITVLVYADHTGRLLFIVARNIGRFFMEILRRLKEKMKGKSRVIGMGMAVLVLASACYFARVGFWEQAGGKAQRSSALCSDSRRSAPSIP